MNEATLRFSLRADALGANPCASLREAVRKPLIWPDTDEGILVLGQNTHTPLFESCIAMLYSLPCRLRVHNAQTNGQIKKGGTWQIKNFAVPESVMLVAV